MRPEQMNDWYDAATRAKVDELKRRELTEANKTLVNLMTPEMLAHLIRQNYGPSPAPPLPRRESADPLVTAHAATELAEWFAQ